MIVQTNNPFTIAESLQKMEMQPIVTAPLFFGAGVALVLAFVGETVTFTSVALGFFVALMGLGILAEMRLRHTYEKKFIGLGADGFSTLEKNTPYETLARGCVEEHHWKFAVVSLNPKEKACARFILTEEHFPDHFIKVGHEILPLKDRSPGEKSTPVKGVVHKLDPDAVAASRPPEQHKRQITDIKRGA